MLSTLVVVAAIAGRHRYPAKSASEVTLMVKGDLAGGLAYVPAERRE